jgi:hypothetical protein
MDFSILFLLGWKGGKWSGVIFFIKFHVGWVWDCWREYSYAGGVCGGGECGAAGLSVESDDYGAEQTLIEALLW